MIEREVGSNAELARVANLNENTIRGWFKGDRKRFPVADDLYRAARALGTSVEYLVAGEGPPMEERDPDLEEILRMLRGRNHDQLVELRGVIRSYLDTHLTEPKETVAGA